MEHDADDRRGDADLRGPFDQLPARDAAVDPGLDHLIDVVERFRIDRATKLGNQTDHCFRSLGCPPVAQCELVSVTPARAARGKLLR